MADLKSVYILFCSLLLLHVDAAPSYQDILNFYTNAIQCASCFPDKIFPRTNQKDQITVDINFTLLSLGEFNEQNGYLEVNGLMDVIWTDELIADVSGPPSVTEISVPRDNVWVPTISVFNSHSNISMIGDASTDVRITMPSTTSGEMKWSPSVVSKTNCPIDFTFFPFDTQKCNLTLTPWGYTDSEVNISVAGNLSLDLSQYIVHEQWNLKDFTANTENKNNQSFLFYELTLQRKPKYFLLTYLLPFLMLVFLSNLIFVMPSDSGERVSFAMLIFLSVAILMSMVSQSMPKTSTQMSILAFFFVIMLVIVSIITYLAILSLTIHSKDPTSPIPPRIVTLIALCGCYENKHKDDLSKIKRNKVSALSLSEYDDDDLGYFSHPKLNKERFYEEEAEPIIVRKDNKVYKNDYDITWKHVANTVDKICLVTFLVVNILVTVMFITPLLADYYK